MTRSLSESIIEDAALELFEDLDDAVGHWPHLAPGELAEERGSLGVVVLVGRRRETIRQLNPASSMAPRTTVAKSTTVQSRSWLN
jgi:type I restriction enzyme, R subunit